MITNNLMGGTDLFKQRRYSKWDHRFLELAMMVSSWSKDPSTQVGAVIVRPDFTVASLGFNGFPKRMPDRVDLYENREEKYSRIIHAEMNALLHCNENVKGFTLYTIPFAPCDRCFVQMAQAGIERFVAPTLPTELISRWGASLDKTKQYAAEMGLELVEYDMSKVEENQ